MQKFLFIIATILIFINTSKLFADERQLDSATTSKPSAMQLFNESRYEEALKQLQEHLSQGNDYYNAAGCYFKLAKYGEALSYYEKALRLLPGHPDVEFNLNLTKKILSNSRSVYSDPGFFWSTLIPYFNLRDQKVFLFIFAIFCLSLSIIFFSKLPIRALASSPINLLIGGLWLVSAATLLLSIYAKTIHYAAIIGAPTIVRSGPSEQFIEIFKFPAGSKVQLTGESRENWSQVRFSLGNVGWIMKKEFLEL